MKQQIDGLVHWLQLHLTMIVLGSLAVVDMASDGCVPLAGLDVFPLWTTLEIDIALGVEHMQMDGRGGATWSHRDTRREWQSPLPCLFVDDGENFLLIIHNGCKVSELFGNNGFYSLNNLKGLAIFVFFVSL